MKKIILLMISVAMVFASCETQQDIIDTGVSNPVFDGTIMEYLRSNDYNWGLTVEMIEKAGLVDLFEGNDPEYPEITFLAFPTYSIYHYLYPLGEQDISNLSAEECRDFVMSHVIKGKYLKENIAFRNIKYLIFEPEQTGYTELVTEEGNVLRAFLQRGEWGGVPETGAIIMGIYSMNASNYVPLATPNIQPSNGVVHALDYNYVLGNI